MDVSVIIVTHNSAEFILPCVESAASQEGVSMEIIVVDNASTDTTCSSIRNADLPIQLIANTDNRGFGTACNQAAALAHGRYLYFLNPDAELLRSGDLLHLIRTMESHPQWGLCGTGVEGRESPPIESRYPGEKHLYHPLPKLPGRIAWLLGASMLIRKPVFDSVGGFDERIFLYGEETDLCLKVRKAGFEIGLVQNIKIRHAGGASESGYPSRENWMRRFAGLSQFYLNHYHKEDVARLWNRDLRRARWRLTLLTLTGQRSRQPEKWAKYSAMKDSADRYLEELAGKRHR